MADQVFVFKRTVRETAMKHNITATFMATPVSNEPGSSMHIHQSVLDEKTGDNIFSDKDGKETDAFYHFIGGMQTDIAEFIPLFAPNVNSYRHFLAGSLLAGLPGMDHKTFLPPKEAAAPVFQLVSTGQNFE